MINIKCCEEIVAFQLLLAVFPEASETASRSQAGEGAVDTGARQ